MSSPSIPQTVSIGWELDPPASSGNGWEILADAPSQPKHTSLITPAHTTHPATAPAISPNDEFSPMPSLNAIPDPGWACWGEDPSRIKKEEDQVQRPGPTHGKLRNVVSNTTRNAGDNGASSPKIDHPTPAPLAPASLVSRDPALAAKTVKLSPATFIQQPSPYQTTPTSQVNVNCNMRQLHPVPVTYSTRPTFQYGKVASNVTPAITSTTLPTDSALDFTPPQLQNSTSGHANWASPQPTSSAETGVRKVTSPFSNKISVAQKSDCNHVSSIKGGNGVLSAVEPPMDDHSTILDNSASADSGHASSVEVPSTILASSVISTRPKVNLPHYEQKEQQSPCPMKQSTGVSGNQMNLESQQTKFKLSIPKTLSVPKALLALDFVNLVAFGGEKVKIDVSLQTRTIEFQMKGDTADIRQHCKFLINIALDALKDACAPEMCEVEDFPTRKLLEFEVLDAPEEHQTDEEHTLSSLPLASMDAASSNADTLNQKMHTNALELLLSMSKESTVLHATSSAMPSTVNTTSTLLQLASSARSEPACASEVTAGIKLAPVGTSTTITPNDDSHDIPTQEPILVHALKTGESEKTSPKPQENSAFSGELDVMRYPYMRRNRTQVGLFEICLPLPEQLVHKTGRNCRLEERIPIAQTAYASSRGQYILRDANAHKLEFARSVLLVIIYFKAPEFSSSNPVLQLEQRTPAHVLLQELREDPQAPLSSMRMGDLTAYVIKRLHALANLHSSSKSLVVDSPVIRKPVTTVAVHSRQPSSETVQPKKPEHLNVNVGASVNESESLAEPAVSSIQSMTSNPPHDVRLAEAIQNPKDAIDVAQLGIQDVEGVVTESNSICWYLPEGPSRGRFIGKGAKHLKTIRRATGIADIFWKSESGHGSGWFLILLASQKQTLTDEQRRQLGHAFRICKSWAIMMFAPDMLPLHEDLPQALRQDSAFRLDLFELGEAWNGAVAQKRLPWAEQSATREGALDKLVESCRRPHAHNLIPCPIFPRSMWPGVISELSTEDNSISWTVKGLQQVQHFGGRNHEHMRTIETISGVAAIKFDNNERRYGQNTCRIYLLGSINPVLAEQELHSLLQSFRLLVAAMKMLSFVSLFPTVDNLCASSFAAEAFDLARSDDVIIATLPSALINGGISSKTLLNIASHLFGDSSASRVCPTNESHTSTCSSGITTTTLEETAPYDGYRSLRDITEFAWVYPVDDGYMTPLDEDLFEDTSPHWADLHYQQRMSLIGSACWALRCVEPLLSRAKGILSDATSIGPSASQVGGASSGSTISHASPFDRRGETDYSGWEAARDQVAAADGLQPRIQNWVKEIPDERPFVRDAESSDKPIATSRLENNWTGDKHVTSPFATDKVTVELNIPSDKKLRMAILGESQYVLQQISIHTGAGVSLAPLQAGQQEEDRPIRIIGQPRNVNRAIQMSKTAVLTQFPKWRFSFDVQRVIQHLKVLEAQKLADSPQDFSKRWNIGLLTFIPKESISCVSDAIKSGAFVTSCAIFASGFGGGRQGDH